MEKRVDFSYGIEKMIIPNTAVFGPTNFIGTTTTARMKISDEDFG